MRLSTHRRCSPGLLHITSTKRVGSSCASPSRRQPSRATSTLLTASDHDIPSAAKLICGNPLCDDVADGVALERHESTRSPTQLSQCAGTWPQADPRTAARLLSSPTQEARRRRSASRAQTVPAFGDLEPGVGKQLRVPTDAQSHLMVTKMSTSVTI